MQANKLRTTQHAAPLEPLLLFGAALKPDGSPTQTLRNRVAAAVRFGQSRPTILYIPTGGAPKNAQTEASVMRKLLRAHAIPDTSILLEDTAPDTFASIKACSAVLRRLKHPKRAPLYFATSTYHAPRCWVLLRLAGWMPHAVPYHPFPIFPQSSYAKVLLIVAHEILATLWDSLLVLLWRIVR